MYDHICDKHTKTVGKLFVFDQVLAVENIWMSGGYCANTTAGLPVDRPRRRFWCSAVKSKEPEPVVKSRKIEQMQACDQL